MQRPLPSSVQYNEGTLWKEAHIKHLKLKSKPRPIRAHTNPKAAPIQDPCPNLEGKELTKCEKKAYKGGVVY